MHSMKHFFTAWQKPISYSSWFVMIIFLLVTGVVRSQSMEKGAFPLKELIDSASIPGISIAFIEKGKLSYSEALGVKNVEIGEAIDTNTIFEAASLTKPIVAYCAMKMVELGKLDLDKPLYQYMEYPDVAKDDRYKLITARMVLSHNTGFPNWRANRSSDKMKINFDPGSHFGYSGEGFVFLQKVMEKLEGANLNTLAKKWVFEPLGMSNSSLIFPDTENYAVGHNPQNEARNKFKPNSPNAAYSMHTTAEDYAKFLIELLQPTGLNNSLQEQMIQQQVLMDSSDPSLAWGLGVGIYVIEDEELIWHWGDNGIFRAFFIISPQQKKGFVYFTNSQNGLSIVNRLLDYTFSNPEIMKNWKEYDQF